MTKACTNNKCPAYAHFVYTVAMRCVLCRCDLKSAQRFDALGDNLKSSNAGGRVASSKAGRAHAAR